MKTMMAEQMGLTNQDTTIDEMPAQCSHTSAAFMVGSVDTRQHNCRNDGLQRRYRARKDTDMRPIRLISHADVRQAQMLAANSEPIGMVHAA